MPPKAGDRVKTDRRDAMPLARLARSGERTAVSVPKVEEEALRAQPRARDDTLSALTAAQFRLKACVLSHDIRSRGRAHWSPAPLRWRSDGVCPPPAQQIVLQAYVRVVPDHTARRQRLEQARQAHVHAWRVPPVGDARAALRGVQGPVAGPRGADLGALTRCESPSALRQCVGVVPADVASGERRQQGALTQAGKAQARKALVEGAWAYRSPAKVSRPRPLRLENHPSFSRTSAGKPQAGWANDPANVWPEATRRPSSPEPWPVSARASWRPWPNRCQS